MVIQSINNFRSTLDDFNLNLCCHFSSFTAIYPLEHCLFITKPLSLFTTHCVVFISLRQDDLPPPTNNSSTPFHFVKGYSIFGPRSYFPHQIQEVSTNTLLQNWQDYHSVEILFLFLHSPSLCPVRFTSIFTAHLFQRHSSSIF